VGSALEKVYAKTIDEHLGELASHFLESGDKSKALDYFLKAGDRAMKVYANRESASYLQSALGLLEEKKDEFHEKGRVLEQLGDIKRLLGEYNASMKCWNDALLLWKQLDEKEATARLHRKAANVSWLSMGDTKKAREHHEAALRILETEPEGVELASLYEDMAGMVAMGASGDMVEALSLGEKAVELAKKLNAHEVMAHSYMWLGEISEWLGDSKKAVECFERALKIALDNGYMEIAVWAYDDLALWIPTEENEKKQEYYEKAFALAKKVGTVDWIALIGLHLAHRYLEMGKLDRAISMAEESASLNRRVTNRIQLTWSLGWLGIFYEISGETDKSLQCSNEAVSISKGLDDWQANATAFVALGWLYYRRGEYAEAKELMEKGRETVEKHGVKMGDLAQWIVGNYIELGELEKAESLIDSFQKFAIEGKHRRSAAYAYALRGTLLRAQKRWEESIEQFEKSVQEFEALCARQWNMYDLADHVLFEYARVYFERNQEGDKEKALDLLGQAIEIFQKMGAKKDVEKVEERIAFIETGKVVSKPKPTEHVSTGYADLDKLLYGGIPSNCAVVLTSPSCNERDLLIKSFLDTGAKKGEVTFYLTTSARAGRALAEEFPSSFCLFVCNPQAALAESSPNVFKLNGVENLTEISIALTSAIRKLNASQKDPRRACIEIVSDALLQHHAVQTRKWLTALTTELTSAGFTILAVVDPQMHPPEELHAILGLFDGEISICEKGAEQFLKIKRMSNQKYLKDELLLKEEGMQK
jgi:tetratricopeptide (TPR) repeat protein